MPTLAGLVAFASGGLYEATQAAGTSSVVAWDTGDPHNEHALRFGVNADIDFPIVGGSGTDINVIVFRVGYESGSGGLRRLNTYHTILDFDQQSITVRDKDGVLSGTISLGVDLDHYVCIYAPTQTSYNITIKVYDSDLNLVTTYTDSGLSGLLYLLSDITFSGDANGSLIFKVKSIVALDLATLADCIPYGIHTYSSTLASATPDSGTALDIGNWTDATNHPWTASEIQYTGGIASGHVYTDDVQREYGRGPYKAYDATRIAQYYFDASDAGPTDPDNAFSNEANAFDGDTATVCQCNPTVTGTLSGEGTTAISTGAAFVALGFTSNADGAAGDRMTITVTGDGGTPTYSQKTSNYNSEDVAAADTLSYSDIQALEISYYWDAGGSAGSIRASFVNVYSQMDFGPFGIVGAKYTFSMSRGNGGGTEHYAVYGNSNDTPTTTADLVLDTVSNEYFYYSNSATVVPTDSEYFAVGMAKNGGGRDLKCRGMSGSIAFGLRTRPTFPYHSRRIKREDMRTLINL